MTHPGPMRGRAGAPQDPHGLRLRQALEAASGITEERQQVEALLAALVPHLAEDERRAALSEALAAVREPRRAGSGPGARGTGPLPGRRRAPQHSDRGPGGRPSHRGRPCTGRCAGRCRAHLGDDERRGGVAVALSAARGVDDEWQRACAVALAARLLPEGRPGALVEALEMARGIGNAACSSHAPTALAPRLRGDELHQALAIARGIEGHGPLRPGTDGRGALTSARITRQVALSEALAATRADTYYTSRFKSAGLLASSSRRGRALVRPCPRPWRLQVPSSKTNTVQSRSPSCTTERRGNPRGPGGGPRHQRGQVPCRVLLPWPRN